MILASSIMMTGMGLTGLAWVVSNTIVLLTISIIARNDIIKVIRIRLKFGESS